MNKLERIIVAVASGHVNRSIELLPVSSDKTAHSFWPIRLRD